MVPIWGTLNKYRKYKVEVPGAGKGQNGELLFSGYRVYVEDDGKVLSIVVPMVIQPWQCT